MVTEHPTIGTPYIDNVLGDLHDSKHQQHHRAHTPGE